MSRSGAPTVAALKQLLEARGLPTTGLKADLMARLEAARAEDAAANPDVSTHATFMGLPLEARRLIGRNMNAEVFYFSEKMNNLKTIEDTTGRLEGIFPTELEWDIGTGRAKRADGIPSKAALKQKLVEIMDVPGLKSVTMKRDHLTVRVELNRGERMEIQILLVYPGVRTAAAYELKMYTSIAFDPVKRRDIVFAQFVRHYHPSWSDAEASLGDAKKALKDVFLGVHWVRTYLAKGLQLYPNMTNDSMKFILEGLTPDPLRDTKDAHALEKAFEQGLKKTLGKK